MWVTFALLSAVFAALTSILAKIGIEGVNSNLATAIRTAVVLVLAWGIVFATGAHHGIIAIDFGHQTGRVLVLNLENFALDAVPVGGYLHLSGNT